jgi:hypothetical protein
VLVLPDAGGGRSAAVVTTFERVEAVLRTVSLAAGHLHDPEWGDRWNSAPSEGGTVTVGARRREGPLLPLAHDHSKWCRCPPPQVRLQGFPFPTEIVGAWTIRIEAGYGDPKHDSSR